MPKNHFKAKSSRKPLRDVSNGVNPSKSVKKKATKKEDQVGDDAQDRILLALSSLIHQIDELVVQALKLKVTSEKGRKEIDSFAHVLSEMQTSLKLWVSKFQRAHSIACKGSENQLEQPLADKTVPSLTDSISNVVDSPDQNNLDSLVSPSPLVSWRVDCTTESSRQLFLLTPLPRPKGFSSRLQGSYISVPENITLNGTVGVASHLAISGDTSDDLLEGVAIKPTPSKPPDSVITKMESTVEHGFVSPPKVSKRECCVLVMTPCLKMSPPRSCVLLEPISEISHKDNHGVCKSTPCPVAVENFSGSQNSDSSSSQVSEHLALKYPELFGLKPASQLGNGRKVVGELPDWFMSPPKSCVLMEPPDERSSNNDTANCQLRRTVCALNRQTTLSFMKENDIQCSHFITKQSCNQEIGGSSVLIESTPIWKEPESTIGTRRHPGENTLKKELWTKFEAASTQGIRFNVSVLQETAQKGFLDRLDEVSRDETSQVPEGLR